MVIGGVLLLLVVAFFVVRRRMRRAANRDDLADGFGRALPRRWAGPGRLPGRPSLRAPGRIPRPVAAVLASPAREVDQ